ncbi:MAG: TolC family protein [Thiotrichales bacterium]|nr:TolC family protein [Thiotrichales bacterium]
MAYQPGNLIRPGATFRHARTSAYRIFLFLLAGLVTACVNYRYQPEPIDVDAYLETQLRTSTDAIEFRDFLRQVGHAIQWPVRKWDLDTLVLAQLFFNPDISIAVQGIPVEQANLLIARQRINPELSIPLEHHSDTSGGVSPWLIGLVLDLVYEREGKREARIAVSGRKAELARIAVETIAWDQQQQLQSAYVDYYSAISMQGLLQGELKILEQMIALLQRRIEAGEASQFEVSVNRLEYQKKLLALTRHQALKSRHFQTIISLAGIALDPDENEIVFDPDRFESPLMVLAYPEIRELALLNRMDIRRALAEYEIYEAELRLQIEHQYPDITLSPGFIFDQDDKIWALGTAWLLPVFHNNDGQIEKALAERKLMQEKFKALQRNIILAIEIVWVNYENNLAAYNQSLSLLKDVKNNSSNIQKQYEIGYADQLDLLRSQLEVKRLELSVLELKTALLKSISGLKAELQQTLGTHYDHRDALASLIHTRIADSAE